jgi:hypothetical protein
MAIYNIRYIQNFEITYADNFSQELYLEEAETNEGSQEFLDEASNVLVHNPRHHGAQTLLLRHL